MRKITISRTSRCFTRRHYRIQPCVAGLILVKDLTFIVVYVLSVAPSLITSTLSVVSIGLSRFVTQLLHLRLTNSGTVTTDDE